MIGRELVPLLLRRTDMEICLLLHQCGASSDQAMLLRELFSLPADAGLTGRLHLLAGDMTKHNVGLSDEDYRTVTKDATHILHAAATTKFDLPLEEARRINLGGTKHLVQLAGRCDKLEQFGFLSTAYVSGKRCGIIREDERCHDQGFVNSYEQSKYEAESVVEAGRERLPTAIYRLSTIIGDSKTGRVSHFSAPHHALRMIYWGLAAMVPGTPDYAVDLIPADYAAQTLFRLFTSHFQPGRVFHITAGANRSYSLQTLIDESYRFLSDLDKDWENRGYPKPAIVSQETFDLFSRTVEQANNPILLSGLNALKHFVYQLNYPKQFDRTNLLRCIPDYERALPDIRDYYHKVVAYCLKTRWGKHHGSR